MIRVYFSSAVCLLLAALSAPAAGTDDSAAIDAIVAEAMKSFNVPGLAVAVVHDDKVVYLKGHGVRAIGKNDPVTPDTLFPIASCTKAFTTAAMAILVDEGKLGWDDPVRKHVPKFHLSDPLADSESKLRDLVTHRTGVGSNDFLWYRAPWGRDEAVRRIGLVKQKHPFRTAFEYQSTMFTVAGLAVESASGRSWEQFVQDRLFTPLAMKRSVFSTPAARKDPNHAEPHQHDSEGTVRSMPWYVIEHPEAAGSIHASAHDLSNWLRLQVGDGTFEGKRLVSAINLGETHRPQMVIPLKGRARAMNPDTAQLSYGMAWVIQDHRGQLLASHAGLIDGFRTHITLVPRARLGIALLNNLDHTEMNLAISNAILDRLLGLTPRDWNAFVLGELRKQEEEGRRRTQAWWAKRQLGTSPTRPLTAFAGTYTNPAYGSVTIDEKDGKLIWKWNAFSSPLFHYHFNTFVIQDDMLRFPEVLFRVDRDGDISAMQVAYPLEAEFSKSK